MDSQHRHSQEQITIFTANSREKPGCPLSAGAFTAGRELPSTLSAAGSPSSQSSTVSVPVRSGRSVPDRIALPRTPSFARPSSRHPHESCGVMGVSLRSGEAAGYVYTGLYALQHRGQEGAGIAVARDGGIFCQKGRGLVGEVFTEDILSQLPRDPVAIGHVRYSTTGEDSDANIQPFVKDYLTGRIALAHNGNLTNAEELKARLIEHGLAFSATSDSEVLTATVALSILNCGDFFEGCIRAAERLRGSFSLVIMDGAGRMVALRDPHGMRPLCLGRAPEGIAVASESCALSSCGFPFLRDIVPGEAVLIEAGALKKTEIRLTPSDPTLGPCIFEYIYFARTDSVLDGHSVYEARYQMGRALAREAPVQADAVCGVPDSGLTAAEGYASESGLPLIQGFVKNRYVGRSFICPEAAMRERAVKLKLSPLVENVRGRRLILVDDSIVRGTTSRKIVELLRNAGAKEVHLRISAPPFVAPCHYGTDIDRKENLLACQMTLEEIRRATLADSLHFISLDALKTASGGGRFCTRCFDPTAD